MGVPSMSFTVILTICLVKHTIAQFPDSEGSPFPQRGLPQIPIRPGRFQKVPGGRPAPLPAALANQRFRRPISFKARSGPLEDPAENSPGSGPRPIKAASQLDDNQHHSQSSPPPLQVKPVNEESEESEEEDVAQAIANLGAVSHLSQSSGNLVHGPLTPQPIQFRPLSGPTARPEQNVAPVQYRPQKPAKPRQPIPDDIPEPRPPIKHHPKPVQAKLSQDGYDSRRKKPVAQIIKRYREDNPDGSITWGFENDDGSYKEELIGIDCITRGKYGYIDPDGIRREYTYETGIKCDEQEQEEEKENGFVDYQENKLVLPNGKTIDLSSMGKKQVRRPGPNFRP